MAEPRRRVGEQNEDSGHIDNIQYNSYSGAQKNVSVGPSLEYVGALDTAIRIREGEQYFVFNPTGGILYVTFGEESAPAAGTAPADNTFPAFATAYTPMSSWGYKFIIAQAGMHLYKLRDDSFVRRKTD